MRPEHTPGKSHYLMPDTPSITIVKQFRYRNTAAEKFSNKYHFDGPAPTTDAGWKALADAIFAKEKEIMWAGVSLVGAYGYEAGNENAVAIIDYTVAPLAPVPGTAGGNAATATPGDVALWVRWNTGTRNSRGKYVYLRKYFHGVPQSDTDNDAPTVGAKNAANAFAAAMYNGTLPGGVKICGPQGDDVQAHLVAPFFTTRTLKRRGKRPSR